MTHPVLPPRRARRQRNSRRPQTRRFGVEPLEERSLLAAGPVTYAEALAPAPAPVLAAQSDTGISNSDGFTKNNGSAGAPLVFNVPNLTAGLFYNFYDVTNPAAPVLLSGPIQKLVGNSFTISNQTLAAGTHRIAYTSAASAGGTQSTLSQSASVTVQSSLRVVSVSPSVNFLTSLPNNQVVVTFNGYLAGFVPDKADGSGFASDPFAVMLVPSGPEGGGQFAKGDPLWNAPYGVDGGDLPIPGTLVYHQNADGTSTITLKLNQQLNTDIYLISISNGLTDLAGNPLTDSHGNTGPQYSSFDLNASPQNTAPLNVVTVTANNGATVINNNLIPQPDTIGIRFNKPLNIWTVNTGTIRLLAKTGPTGVSVVPAAVAYSPTTNTAYLTPEAILTPGTIYYVQVDASVSDDQNFPNPGVSLSQPFVTSFTVNAPGVGAGQSPLRVTATNPTGGTVWAAPFGYGAVTFSEPINLASLGRYSAMLIPQTGGVSTGTSGYADVPLNAKLAFNPNTNQLIIVPTTGLLPDNTVYLFALSAIRATNGDALTVPGGGPTFYTTFLLRTPGATASAARASNSAAETAVTAGASSNASVTGTNATTASSSRGSTTEVRSSRVASRPRTVVAAAPTGPLALVGQPFRRG